MKPLLFVVSEHSGEGVKMPADTICKTVHQYSRKPVPDGDMQKLLDIAEDYRQVKKFETNK